MEAGACTVVDGGRRRVNEGDSACLVGDVSAPEMPVVPGDWAPIHPSPCTAAIQVYFTLCIITMFHYHQTTYCSSRS